MCSDLCDVDLCDANLSDGSQKTQASRRALDVNPSSAGQRNLQPQRAMALARPGWREGLVCRYLWMNMFGKDCSATRQAQGEKEPVLMQMRCNCV